MIIPKGENPNYEHFKNKAHELVESLNPAFPWIFTAKRYRKQRSNAQNDYHFGVVVKTICDETGNEKNQVHEHMLGEHVGWVEYDFLGETRRRPARRSKDMNVEEFENFNEWCRAWAASELGIIIPMPGEGL